MNQFKGIFKRFTWDGLRHLLQQYPFVMGVAVTKVVLLICLVKFTDSKVNIDYKYDELINTLTRVVGMLFLATPLLLGLAWRKIQVEIPWRKQLLGVAIIGVILVIYYFSLPQEPSQKDYYRYGLYVLAVHLGLSAGRFLFKNSSLHTFWQYNISMLLQGIMSTVYTAILFLGTAIGIYSIQQLFGLFENNYVFVYCFVFFATFLHTVFFIKGVEHRAAVEQDGLINLLKLLTQYALLPLVILYMLILYAYGMKISLQWELPEGGVGYLVISLGGAGILSYLLTYPFHHDKENRFIHTFARYFFVLFVPLNILLLVGTWRRINDYGITENRYLLLIIGVWLAIISVYFWCSKRKDIRLIPISLLVLCLVISIGPWGMFSVSTESQANRLINSLQTHRLLSASQQFQPQKDYESFSEQDYEEVFSIVRYLAEKGEIEKLESIFGKSTDSLVVKKLQSQIGDTLRNYVQPDLVRTSYHLVDKNLQRAIPIEGFSKLWNMIYMDRRSHTDLGDGYRVTIPKGSSFIQLYRQDTLLAQWDAAAINQQLREKYGLTSNEVKEADFTFDTVNGKIKARLRLHNWSLQDQSKLEQVWFGGNLLLKE